MAVISVRLEDQDLEWLRKRGQSPGTFARAAVHEAIRREEIREARRWLDANGFTSPTSAVELIREDRESDHGRDLAPGKPRR